MIELNIIAREEMNKIKAIAEKRKAKSEENAEKKIGEFIESCLNKIEKTRGRKKVSFTKRLRIQGFDLVLNFVEKFGEIRSTVKYLEYNKRFQKLDESDQRNYGGHHRGESENYTREYFKDYLDEDVRYFYDIHKEMINYKKR